MMRVLFAAVPLLWLSVTANSSAQTSGQTPAAPMPPQPETIHVFYLQNTPNTQDLNEVLTTVRVLLPPSLHIYSDVHQHAIVVRATPDELAQVQQIIDALDRPSPKGEAEPARNNFRLTYTVSELDNGKRISLQHFSTVIAEGGHTTLKDGTRVPMRTGPAQITSTTMVQFSYLDVGFNFDSSLDTATTGERLRTKIEQSSAFADTQEGVQEPVNRETTLELTAFLQPGKPLVLGSMDIPGSARHVEIEALLEPIR